MIKSEIYSERMRIRIIKKKDFSFISGFYIDYYYYKYAIGIYKTLSEEDFDSFIMHMENNNNYFYCISKLIDDNSYIGFIKGYIYNCNKKILWITSIMVDQKYLRQGYAGELVKSITAYYKLKLNIECIYISVSAKNKIGNEFWKKQGFVIFKTINQSSYIKKEDYLGNIIIYRKFV